MQACTFHIFSSVDGEPRQFKTAGTFAFSKEKTELFYADENSNVCIRIEKSDVLIRRTGDYELLLPLQNGKKTVGKIGLGGTQGDVEISTKKTACDISATGGEFSAEYALHFGAELQRMKLRVKVKI